MKRRRSSSGTCGSIACASTRKLKSSCDSSRLMYSAGSRNGSLSVLTGRGRDPRLLMASFFEGGQGGGLTRSHVVGIEMAGEHRALADLAVDFQACVVQTEDVLDDRQAQAGATAFA
ncbi:hypothetical protein D3C81_608790 [compost metagenome]